MAIVREWLEAYSRGEMTRREISELSGDEVGFGVLLGLLHEHGLRLPRFPTDPRSPGVALVRGLAERNGRGG